MPYKKIILRNGLLQVEKYSGVIEFDDILNGDSEAYDIEISSGENFMMIADVSEATFPNISLTQFEELFEIVNNFASTTNGMRHAFYTAHMDYEDFMKVNHYLEIANSKAFSMVSFSDIESAYQWLNMTKPEIEKTNQFLFNQ